MKGWEIPHRGRFAAGAMPGLMAGALPARQLRHPTASTEFDRAQLQLLAMDRAVHGRNTVYLPHHSHLPRSPQGELLSKPSSQTLTRAHDPAVFFPTLGMNTPAGCRTASVWGDMTPQPGNAPRTPQSHRLLCPERSPVIVPRVPVHCRAARGCTRVSPTEAEDAETGSFAKSEHLISSPMLQAQTRDLGTSKMM